MDSLLAGLPEGAEVIAVTPNGNGDWAYVEYVDREGTKHCRGVCTCGSACPCHGRRDYYCQGEQGRDQKHRPTHNC